MQANCFKNIYVQHNDLEMGVLFNDTNITKNFENDSLQAGYFNKMFYLKKDAYLKDMNTNI